MRKWIILMLIGLVGVVPAFAQEPPRDGLGDPYYPDAGNPGYDVQNYILDMTVDVPTNSLDATVTIEAIATADLDQFNLDFIGLTLQRITVNADPAQYLRDGSEILIAPATPIAADEAFTVVVNYSGVPTPVNDPGLYFIDIGWLNFDDTIYIVGPQTGSMGWFPGNHYPTDKATFTFRVTTAPDYVVAANGLLVETIENGTSTTTVWRTDNPMAPHLAAIYIGKFVVETFTPADPDGVPIINYYTPSVRPRQYDEFARVGEMITYFETIIGPYPFESYGAVVVPDPNFIGVALENQTLSVFGLYMVDESVAAHELAHQWFGNSITPARWQDMWLNEGFATYFAALWTEYAYGADAFARYMTEVYDDLGYSAALPIGDPGLGNIYDYQVYYKGAWTLHALRLTVGDAVFFDIIRTYYTTYQYGNATIADFIAIADSVSGQDLTDFFDAWLYQTGLPPVPVIQGDRG